MQETNQLGFTPASESKTGALLRTLAATKRGGNFLELGTGTGVGPRGCSPGWTDVQRLVSVDTDPNVQDVAKRNLGDDHRVTFLLGDGAAFLEPTRDTYDFIYADAWPGKFTHLDLALASLKVGGIYFIDDLLPQQNWPEGHAPRVRALIADLEQRRGFIATKMAWASGLMILVRIEGRR